MGQRLEKFNWKGFQVFVVVLLGFEIHGHMDPDNMMIEAIMLGICLGINIICAFYKLYIDKK